MWAGWSCWTDPAVPTHGCPDPGERTSVAPRATTQLYCSQYRPVASAWLRPFLPTAAHGEAARGAARAPLGTGNYSVGLEQPAAKAVQGRGEVGILPSGACLGLMLTVWAVVQCPRSDLWGTAQGAPGRGWGAVRLRGVQRLHRATRVRAGGCHQLVAAPSSPCCRHKSLSGAARSPHSLGTGRGLGPGAVHFRGRGTGLSALVGAEPWGGAGHWLKLSDCFYFHINKTEPKAALI